MKLGQMRLRPRRSGDEAVVYEIERRWYGNETDMVGAPTWHVVLCDGDKIKHHHPPDPVNGLRHQEVKQLVSVSVAEGT